MFYNNFSFKYYIPLQKMDSKVSLIICLGSSCFARGNKFLVYEIQKFLSENKLEKFVDFKGARCFGNCKDGPFCKINNNLYKINNLDELKQYLFLYINKRQ